MSLIYHRYINGIEIRFGQYSAYEFAIYIGHKLYALIDNLADANREYNAINTDTLRYLGL
jgi:hypothetical protein